MKSLHEPCIESLYDWFVDLPSPTAAEKDSIGRNLPDNILHQKKKKLYNSWESIWLKNIMNYWNEIAHLGGNLELDGDVDFSIL